MKAPVKFIGIQQGFGPLKPRPFYNATQAFHGGKFCEGTTVSRETLKKEGYFIPFGQRIAEAIGWIRFHKLEITRTAFTAIRNAKAALKRA